jgi:hypothetical protein
LQSGDTAKNKIQASEQPDQGVAAASPDLAFAARVQQSDAPRSQLVSQMAAASPAAWTKKQSEGAEDPANLKTVSNQLQNAVANAYLRTSDGVSVSSRQPQTGAEEIAKAAPPDADAVPQPAAPLKEIVMQIAQPGAAKVDIQVMQQGGEVRVAVRTGDSDLAHGLRQGLNDLVGRLEETGYRTETWRPESVLATTEAATETRNGGSNARGDDSQSQPGWSQQDSGRRNNNQQSDQPRWVEDLESSLTGGSGSSGDSYGLSY